mgnify:CR=1 FL=1
MPISILQKYDYDWPMLWWAERKYKFQFYRSTIMTGLYGAGGGYLA